jgi:aminomethyltransferase
MQESQLRRTPLYDCHKKLGGKFVEFGGWEMPVRYSSLTDEHNAVRNNVGIFDVSHMGEITVSGVRAKDFLQYVTSNDLSKLTTGRAQYSLLLNHDGGVVDDIIVYQLDTDEYLLCVNASNTEKDFSWLVKHNQMNADIKNVSADFSQIAIQGPKSQETLSQLLDLDLTTKNFGPFSVARVPVQRGKARGISILLARTGYTGEDGFELFCESNMGESLWDALLEAGRNFSLIPAGLGARDTLRLEACFPLHGHEIRDDINALSSGLGWVIKFDKIDFVGKAALLKQKELGLRQKLVGLEVIDKGIIREGTKLVIENDLEIGWVTSGTKPPTVNKPVGLAFVDMKYAELGAEFFAVVRDRKLKVVVVKMPFYKRMK